VYSICDFVPPQERCKEKFEGAKAVFVPDNSDECVVVKDDGQWKRYVGEADDRSRKIVFEQAVGAATTIGFDFVCTQTPAPEFTPYYMAAEKQFRVRVANKAGCGVSLNLLRALTENSVVLIVFLAALGVLLNFFGIKFYRDFMLYLLGLLVVVFAFYVYNFFTGANQVREAENPYFMIALSVLVVIAVIGVLIFFTSLIFVLLSFLAAYQLGVYVRDALAGSFTSIDEGLKLWLIVGLLFAVFLVLNWKFQDYFVIVCTALIGSAFLATVVMYCVTKNFDFLFNLEFDDMKDMSDFHSVAAQFAITGVMLFFIGALVQFVLFKRQNSAARAEDPQNKDLRIELRGI